MDFVDFNLLMCVKTSCLVFFLEMLQTLCYMLPPNQYSLKILIKYYRCIWLKDETVQKWYKCLVEGHVITMAAMGRSRKKFRGTSQI